MIHWDGWLLTPLTVLSQSSQHRAITVSYRQLLQNPLCWWWITLYNSAWQHWRSDCSAPGSQHKSLSTSQPTQGTGPACYRRSLCYRTSYPALLCDARGWCAECRVWFARNSMSSDCWLYGWCNEGPSVRHFSRDIKSYPPTIVLSELLPFCHDMCAKLVFISSNYIKRWYKTVG